MSGMTVIRLAQPADLKGVLEVGRATWPPTYTPLVGEEYVQRVLASWWTESGTMPAIADGRVWVAEDGGEITGMAMYGVEDRVVDLWKLYVRPERQAEGTGRALLRSVIDATRDCADLITLAYMDGNAVARTFYERAGFIETRREVDAMGGPDDVWMELRPRAEE
jgi:GNAT superfamily N-acetyltransferase